MRNAASSRLAALLAPFLLGLLAGCAGDPPADADVASDGPGVETADGPASPAPSKPGGPPAPPRAAANATPTRVFYQNGSFLLAVGNPAAVGPEVLAPTQVEGTPAFEVEVAEGETILVVDFYHRSAPFGLALRAVDPEGKVHVAAAPDGSDLPPDPTATRHLHAELEATPGTWSFTPQVYQARANAEWTLAVSLFEGEAPLGYFAPQPA